MVPIFMKPISDYIQDLHRFIKFQLVYRGKIFLKYYLKRRAKEPVFIVAEHRTGS